MVGKRPLVLVEGGDELVEAVDYYVVDNPSLRWTLPSSLRSCDDVLDRSHAHLSARPGVERHAESASCLGASQEGHECRQIPKSGRGQDVTDGAAIALGQVQVGEDRQKISAIIAPSDHVRVGPAEDGGAC